MKYGLLGERLSHSHSPKIHAMLGNGGYSLIEKEKDEVASFLEKREFKGINVTIPYKQTVMPLCDFIDGAAVEIGAVNTVVNCDGKLLGLNTDFAGFIFMCNRAGIDMQGKKVLILGSGGTSNTACAAAKKLGASEVIKVSRTGQVNYENVYGIARDAEIIINTTPVGMYPNTEGRPIELSRFKKLSGVADVVYNPLKTALILEAESLGIKCTGGLMMLVAQAAFADRYFRGVTHTGEEIVKIANRLEKSLSNIVLIGMPGCGKSTVGKILARKTGRELFDLDKVIVEREGRSIPEIFESDGEEYFRRVECEVTCEISKKSGVIIACGGGTVMREENRVSLAQNGMVFYIDRDVSSLSRRGRPLSQGENALNELYNARHSTYEDFADVTVESLGSVEECTEKVYKEFEKNYENTRYKRP